jgi:AraC-like DNA-binding protein
MSAPEKLESRAGQRTRTADNTSQISTMVVGQEVARFLIPARFVNDHLPSSQQFDAWATHDQHLFDLVSAREPSEGFPASRVAWRLDSLLLVQDRLSSHLFERNPDLVKKEPIDHWYFFLQRSGTSEVTMGDRIAKSLPGRLAFRSLGRPVNGTKSDPDSLALFIPRDNMWELAPALDSVNNTILETPLGLFLSDYLLVLERQLTVLTVEDVPRVVEMTRSMIAACMAPSRDRTHAAGGPIAATLFERARRYINENLQSPQLAPEQLSRALGVSRRRLYQLFERYGGVAHYIRGRRLTSCHAAIVNPLETRQIQAIAYDHGFPDPAMFSRLFRAEFGYSPSEAREAIANNQNSLPERPTYFRDWLRSL